MQNRFWLVAIAAALAAAPAAAQNNADEPVAIDANEVTATDANVAMDANMVAATPAVDNGAEPALPPTASELADRARADDDEDRGGIPWGLLGLVGLIGLLGRRRG